MRQTTKEAIAQALESLLEKRSIEKITVKDIVAECGINRQTFYYHFHDIYDLMEWALMQNIGKYAGQHFSPEMDWREQIRALFHFFYLRRTIMLHGYDATNRMQYERVVIQWVLGFIRKRMEDYPQAARVPEEKREFICTVYARGITALFLEWLEAGMPDERHVKLDDYFTIIDGSFGSALDKFAE